MIDAVAELYGRIEVAAEETPEAVSVEIVGPAGFELSESLASEAAPLVARQLYPTRFFGAVLHIEAGEIVGSFFAAVEVIGTPFSAVTIGRPAPAER